MKKIELATKIVDFFKEYDFYNFQDNMIGDEEDEIYRIASSLFNIESINEMITQLTNFSCLAKEENIKEYASLKKLINELSDFKNKNSLDVLIIKPNAKPKLKTIINDYESIERELNGNASVLNYKDNYNIYYDEQAETKNEEQNRVINEKIISGKFIIVANKNNMRKSLTTEEVDNLLLEFEEYYKPKINEIEGGKKLC